MNKPAYINLHKGHTFFLIALTIMTFGLLSASIAHAQTSQTYNYVTQWGSSGSGNGQFAHPVGVAVGSSGNVYVADYENNRIQKFDSNGGYITQWGSYGNGNGQFDYPNGVAVDSSGNVYVADDNNRIQKFDSNGGYITQWGSYGNGNGQFWHPVGVAVDSSGNVYVADDYNQRIQKFDSNGGYITQWGSYGYGNGLFAYPNGVAVDSSGNVYVADSNNQLIQKFNSNGGYITQWGSSGSGNGQFAYPFAVAVDSSGNVYVADINNNRIQKFDSNGGYITQWGSYGNGNGQFDSPQNVAVDSSGNVYVADTYNRRIQKFALEKIIPTITWNNPADIVYGTPLSSTQLNAAATDPMTSNPVSGTFIYTPAEGTVLNAGNAQNLHVDFTPDDTVNYNTASADVTINVKPASFSSITASGFHAPTTFGLNGYDYIWFNSNFKASGVKDGTTIYLTNSIITTEMGNFSVPSAIITFSKNAASTTTNFDQSQNAWITTVPLSGTDDIFLSGMLLPIKTGDLPQDSQVTWNGYFSTNTQGVSINWKWGAAVYTSAPLSDQGGFLYDNINVKASHNLASGYNNGDQAGTPENLKSYLVAGARGGGGSNWTGSWSGTKSVKP